MNLFSFWLFKMWWLEKTSGICRHLNWDKKKARRQTMRTWAKSLAVQGLSWKSSELGKWGLCFRLFKKQQRGQCGQSRGNTRKEAKDATGAPSAWVSQAMMAWLLPWRRWKLLMSSERKWCDVNSFKSSSGCCWDQVVEGKGRIRDVAGSLYDACARCLWLRSGWRWWEVAGCSFSVEGTVDRVCWSTACVDEFAGDKFQRF